MDSKSYVVEYTKFAAKQLLRVPKEIREAVQVWQGSVEFMGLPEVRKSKGYHDEPLQGQRKGQRSVRLNRAYRLIYVESDRGGLVIVGVQEVHKHGD